MMCDDIERICFSADEIHTRVEELGAKIAKDYRKNQSYHLKKSCEQ